MWKSLFYNGYGLLDQIKEGGEYTISGGGIQGPDAWTFNASHSGVYKVQRVNAGVGKSFKISVVTADASPPSNSTYDLYTGVSGYDAILLKMGTADALPVVISFDFQTTAPGVYYGSICNYIANRTYSKAFTVADTAEHHYAIPIPMDKTGTWEYGENCGFTFTLCLAAGSLYEATVDVWQAGNYNHAPDQVNFMASASNVAYLRNVKCDVGNVETPTHPDDINSGLVLAKYQGFFEKSYSQGTPVGTPTRSGGLIALYNAMLYGAPGFRFKTSRRRALINLTGYSPMTGAAGKWYDVGWGDQNVSFNNIGTEGVENVVLSQGTSVYLGHYVANNRMT